MRGLFSARVTWFGLTRTREPSTRTCCVMRVDASSELGDQFTVDLDTAFGDHVLALAARTESRLGKQLLESNGIGIVLRFRSAGICVWHRSPNVAGQILSSQRLSICMTYFRVGGLESQSIPTYISYRNVGLLLDWQPFVRVRLLSKQMKRNEQSWKKPSNSRWPCA